MGAFDGAVLMSDAAIVARRRHSVVTHEALVTLGQVVLRRLVQIAVRRRQAIAAMFARHAAKRPERILQTFGQRHEALAAENHTSERLPLTVNVRFWHVRSRRTPAGNDRAGALV